jgi:hypothetical protein
MGGIIPSQVKISIKETGAKVKRFLEKANILPSIFGQLFLVSHPLPPPETLACRLAGSG